MKDGVIPVTDMVSLSGGMSESTFLATDIGGRSRLRLKSSGYTTYKVEEELLLQGRTFWGSICFHNGRLHSLQLAHPVGGTSWSDFDEAVERQAGDENITWVQRVFGQTPPCTFDWGRVDAGYSPKTGSNTISIYFSA